MATTVLTDKESIRDWAAARMGFPAVVDVSIEAGVQPMLRIVFDQAAYQDQDRAERPQNAGGVEHVEWDEWMEIFEDLKLALIVNEDIPGRRDNFYELVRRDGE
jgi:hypothetical protein